MSWSRRRPTRLSTCTKSGRDDLNQKWVADILYIIEHDKLEKLIKDPIKARKERVEEKNNLLVEMRPELAQTFQKIIIFLRKGNAVVLL